MPKKEVIKYIKGQLKKGNSIEKIKDKLISIGHKPEDVEKAVAHTHQKKVTLKILLVSFFLFLVIVGTFYFQDKGLIKEKSEGGEAEVVSGEGGEGEAEIPSQITPEEPFETLVQRDCETVCEGNGECLIECKDHKLMEKAKLEGDLSLCEKINYNVRREECVNLYYFDKAVLEKNVAFCDKINFDILKENCKREVNK